MKLYDDLAFCWRVLATPEAHDDDAHAILGLLSQVRPITSILELGSGAGPIASHLPDEIDVVLVDRSQAMLDISRELNPGRRHVCADLLTVRLGASFDAVLLHDAAMYLTTEGQVAAALATIAAHLRPGGAALVVPDVVVETFEEHAVAGGGERDGLAVQLLEWHWDPDPNDHTFRAEMSLLIRQGAGPVRAVHESHEMGLWRYAEWWAAIRGAGLEGVQADPRLSASLPGQVFLARLPG